MPDPLRTQSDSGDCPKCGGLGKLRFSFLGGDVEPRPFGENTTIQDMGGSGSRQCECVRDLPAIDGKATWWSSETIYSTVVGIPIGNECCEITADCEIPLNNAGRRLRRTADNAYYPPLVQVEGLGRATLHSDSAREIAAALIAAADACDKADELAIATRDDHGYQGIDNAA